MKKKHVVTIEYLEDRDSTVLDVERDFESTEEAKAFINTVLDTADLFKVSDYRITYTQEMD